MSDRLTWMFQAMTDAELLACVQAHTRMSGGPWSAGLTEYHDGLAAAAAQELAERTAELMTLPPEDPT